MGDDTTIRLKKTTKNRFVSIMAFNETFDFKVNELLDLYNLHRNRRTDSIKNQGASTDTFF
jgi:hypothetical protein